MYVEERLEKTEDVIKEHGKQLAVTNVKFDHIDQRFEEIERRLARIEENQFQQLHGIFAELVTLVKNKL
jgi:CII-binding regulator of phage lambda lysogenization HflD